ncbi:hypothetical protein SALWKB29_2078 [Snodgrassella communis]|uniref:Uncharacterized protein n=1 Tax=Snodgrassella communis TaxID=2946699 RepID=A0A836Z5C7_9NEIS|nr:hypothetical protein SALWKB29_2078 [Snodgrassella communis]
MLIRRLIACMSKVLIVLIQADYCINKDIYKLRCSLQIVSALQ